MHDIDDPHATLHPDFPFPSDRGPWSGRTQPEERLGLTRSLRSQATATATDAPVLGAAATTDSAKAVPEKVTQGEKEQGESNENM